MQSLLSQDNRMNRQDKLDVGAIAKSVMDDFKTLKPLAVNCCIYKVPERARRLHEKAFTPRLVCLGPFHHGKEELKAMEAHKVRYLLDFLEWTRTNLEDFIKCIEKNERKLRSYYAETIELESEKFVRMMLLDATFLIMLILKDRFTRLLKNNDRIFYKPRMINDVINDMIMLENQVPFFILQELFTLSDMDEPVKGNTLIQLTHSFLTRSLGSWGAKDILNESRFSLVVHFLDFARICQRPRRSNPSVKVKKLKLPTATELYNAGVKFKVQESEYKLEIEFEDGVLKIPHFVMNVGAEILLRNLQTYEYCHCNSGEMYFNDYIFLMRELMKSDKDVEILDQGEIIQNLMLNNESVANAFCNMDFIVYGHNFYFSDVLEKLNSYANKTWPKWNANLKQNYFNTPWAGMSVAAAVIILVLTIVQTICSIIQVEQG